MTIEEQFFEAMQIKPTMLCQCSFKNLKDYRYEYGDDNCEHLDDFEFSCKNCEKSIQNIPIYPLMRSDIFLDLLALLIDHDCEIVINNFHIQLWHNNAVVYVSESNNDIKRAILEMFIEYPPLKKLNLKVRALFNAD